MLEPNSSKPQLHTWDVALVKQTLSLTEPPGSPEAKLFFVKKLCSENMPSEGAQTWSPVTFVSCVHRDIFTKCQPVAVLTSSHEKKPKPETFAL